MIRVGRTGQLVLRMITARRVEHARDGGVFTFGDAHFYGSLGGTPLPAPVIGLVPTRTGKGYWLELADASVTRRGDARNEGRS